MTAKVSVCLITYNHERFIEQCVEAALMQETDEPFEIIIGEDCSTDRNEGSSTPDKGAASRKDPDAPAHAPRRRSAQLPRDIGNLEGEYVAFLDGDDYWTSRRKLQHQVDLLDGRPDVAVCGNGYDIRHEGCDGAGGRICLDL